jgi:16S rRNA (uracil1498-N3)-methyltransferase
VSAGPGAGLRAAAAAQVFVEDLEVLALSGEDAHHLGRVLRLRPGELVIAADGHGNWRPCRYRGDSATGGAVIESDGDAVREDRPAPPITLAFVPVKGDRPEWVVQKATEIGVDRIVVLRAARAVVRWEGDRAAKSLERLGRVASEAAAQSRRLWMPELTGPCTLAELAQATAPGHLHQAELGGPPPNGSETAVAVGPEGGWDDGERGLGLPTLGLGPAVLRSETAAVAAAILLCALRDRVVGPL